MFTDRHTVAKRDLPAGLWIGIALALGLGYWLLITWMVIAEYETYNSTSRDLAVYLQIIWNTGHGQPFATTLLEHNRLHVAEHLALLIPVLAPLYAVWPDPRVLLALQQAAITLTGVPIFLWAARSLGHGWAALVLAAYYAMPTLDEVALDAFYPVVFTALPLGLAAYLALRGRPAAACAVALIALPIEEEAGLIAFGLGVYLALARRPRWWGVTLAGVSLVWLTLATAVVMPRFHDPTTLPATANRTAGHFDALRSDPVGHMTAVLKQRVPAASEWLLLPTGGLALVAPEILAIAAPDIGTLLLADNEGRFRRHWVAPALPIIWLATVSGLARLRPGIPRLAGAGFLVAGAMVSFFIDSSLPGGGDYEPFDTVWTGRAEQLERALAEVPADAPAAASRRALPYLANRAALYVFPPSYAGALWPAEPAPRFWVLDLTNNDTRDAIGGRASPLRDSSPPVLWTLGPEAALLTPSQPTLATPADLVFDGAQLQAWEARRTAHAIELLLSWELVRRPARPRERVIRLTDASGREIARLATQPLEGTFPATEWNRGQRWVDRTLWPEDRAGLRIEIDWAERGRPADGLRAIGALTPR